MPYPKKLGKQVSELKDITGASGICGWMCDEVGFLLYALVKFYKPQIVIQTGHLWGKSACLVLEAMTDQFLETEKLEFYQPRGDTAFDNFVKDHSPVRAPVRMISVDPEPYGVPNSEKGMQELTRRYGKAFEYHKMKSDDYFTQFGEQLKNEAAGKRVLGIVDGDHTYNGCFNDLVSLSHIPAGLIFLDDTQWLPEISQAGKTLVDYNYCEFPLYNGIALLTRKV